MHNEGQFVNAARLVSPLGYLFSNPRKSVLLLPLDFLHDAVAFHMRCGTTRHIEGWNGVRIAGGKADDGIGCSWPDGGRTGHWLAARTVVAVGHVDGALLMHNLNEGNLGALLQKGVK